MVVNCTGSFPYVRVPYLNLLHTETVVARPPAKLKSLPQILVPVDDVIAVVAVAGAAMAPGI